MLEAGAVTNVEDVRQLIAAERFRKTRAELQAQLEAQDNNANWQQFSEEIMSGYEAQQQHIQDLEGQIQELKDQLQLAELEKSELERSKNAEIHAIKTTAEAKERKRRETTIKAPLTFPDSMKGLKEWAMSGILSHLRFSEEAWNPAVGNRNFQDCKGVWEVLWKMNETLYRLKYVDDVADIENAFENETGLKYAHSEGNLTANDARLASLRQFMFEGRQFEMWSHVGKGNKPPHLIRVYFAFDDSTKCIIIGYVGPHMENATSRKIH